MSKTPKFCTDVPSKIDFSPVSVVIKRLTFKLLTRERLFRVYMYKIDGERFRNIIVGKRRGSRRRLVGSCSRPFRRPARHSAHNIISV